MFLNSPASVAPLAVTTAAAAITSTVDAQFRAFTIQPTNGTIYLGGAGVTSSTGVPIAQGQTLTLATKEPASFYLVAGSGTVDVRCIVYRGVG